MIRMMAAAGDLVRPGSPAALSSCRGEVIRVVGV